MRKIIALTIGASLLASVSSDAASFKRGVSENQFLFITQMEVLEPGVSWYYNWGNLPTKGYQNELENYNGLEFIPMAWNGNFNADNIRAYVKSHPECKYLLGFNEPNFTNQANMTPAQAAERWPEVQALAKELNLKLVAPVLNYSPDAPYQSPTKWMDEFVALVGNDAFDYTAIHNYGGIGVMKSLATQFHDRYGKDVWVTEFCYWPGGAGNVYVSPENQISEMIQTVEWLEKTPWIGRYAWFKAIGNHDAQNSPNYGLIVTKSGIGPRELSQQGYVYAYMSTFDPDVWHGVNEWVPASEYISQNDILMDHSTMQYSPNPLMISRFNAGAWVEYQFDVPKEDVYKLEVSVGGYGEPSRFDPKLQVFLNNGGTLEELCAAQQFSLPNSDDTYKKQVFTIRLKAGKQTIRLADVNPYQPSGVTIPMVVLADNSGIEAIGIESDMSKAPVYTIDGRIVKGTPSEPGIYICNGRKFVVK